MKEFKFSIKKINNFNSFFLKIFKNIELFLKCKIFINF